MLYDDLGPKAYLDWLRRLGVRYVVLTDAPPDYSARGEAALLRSGRDPLRPVFRAVHLTVLALPRRDADPARAAGARVLSMRESRIVRLLPPGRAATASRFASRATGSRRRAARPGRSDGMIRLTVARPGDVALKFAPLPPEALDALTGAASRSCAR